VISITGLSCWLLLLVPGRPPSSFSLPARPACRASSEGVLAETRGQRVRIYENETLRDKTASEVAHTCIWPSVGLPQGYYPLMTSGRGAFAALGSTVVAHGGVSLEEVVVPFIRVYA
jgi:hypothetical protein